MADHDEIRIKEDDLSDYLDAKEAKKEEDEEECD